jgi:two-component system chemotaxis response regulator CheB
VLSGGLDDGTHGLELIKHHGGIAIAQDPQHAVMPGMPLSAIQNVEVDYILRPSEIGAKLPLLVSATVDDDAAFVPDGPDVAEGIQDNLRTGQVPGPPSPYTCPDCGGALWELQDGNLLRFRCHVGHGYTADALISDQHDELEHTLWAGLRALEEQAGLRRRMARHAERVGRVANAREFERLAKDSEVRAATMRRVLLRQNAPGDLQPRVAVATEAKDAESVKTGGGGSG